MKPMAVFNLGLFFQKAIKETQADNEGLSKPDGWTLLQGRTDWR
jgi:hypothetical protein